MGHQTVSLYLLSVVRLTIHVTSQRSAVYKPVKRFKSSTVKSSKMQDVCNTDPKDHGDRRFYDLPDSYERKERSYKLKSKVDSAKLMKYIDENIIGRDTVFAGPFGKRKVVYCDYTASGRSLKFIENYIADEVLTDYGNTHTTTTVTSLQTTLFRHEARDIIRNAVNASEHDRVVFTGSGCTAAVHLMIHALKLEKPPVIFVSPYEHHSNLLPWREIGSTIIRIEEDEQGSVDLQDLEHRLKSHQNTGKQLIGCFTAASNLTGTLVDDVAVSILLHQYEALAFWDYATAAPYVELDMNPVGSGQFEGLAYKDVMFFSPHKFVGGVGTPGVLIAKKKLFVNPIPSTSGGGTVFFVSREGHRYLKEVEMREEGGTPAIVESIRAGLVFQLKENVSSEAIMEKEEQLCRKAFEAWKGAVPELVLLGSLTARRLPIFSFLVRHPETGLFLHHNFVCAVLNDVFGIQARGGCACAGPFAQDLLGIDEELAIRYEQLILEDSRLDRTHLRRYYEYSSKEMLRPGVVRLNLPYFSSPEEIDFILDSVKMVAREGWKLLPQYVLNPETGEWRHINNQVFKDRKWLGSISYLSGAMTYAQPLILQVSPEPKDLSCSLNEAQKIFDDAFKAASRQHIPDQTLMFADEAATLRWFLLPSEAKDYLITGQLPLANHRVPFKPKDYASNETGSLRANKDNRNSSEFGNERVGVVEISCPLNKFPSTRSEENSGYRPNFSSSSSSTAAGMASVIQNGDACHGVSGDGESTVKCTTCVPRRNQSTLLSGKLMETIPTPTEILTMAIPTTILIGRWHRPSKALLKPTIQAISDFKMISNGDRVMICISGGKDSLSLLHTLRQYRFIARSKGVNFDIGAVTVDPQSEAYDPSSLIPYMASLGVPYFYEEQGILEQASTITELESICSFCSRMKRGRIYACARREGYNVLALGQHLDDLAETFLMSSFHNGSLRTMKAHYTVKEGDLRVVRPFVYVREKNTRQFAEQCKLPVIAENCPACFEAPKERHRTKQLLAEQEVLFPRLFYSLRSALRPLMAIDRCGVEGDVLIYRGLQQRDDDGDDSRNNEE